MKKDKLATFIYENRDAFDDLKAPAGLWEKISPAEQTDHKVHSLWKWMAMAASALLLITVGYLAGTKSQPESRIAGWNEFQEAEDYYQGKVNVKMEAIKALPVSHEVIADIQVLDEVYQQLRNQLLEDPNADANVLLNAMIRHQKQKLEAMDKILERVEKYKTNETQSNEM